jgi:hypothetical protein
MVILAGTGSACQYRPETLGNCSPWLVNGFSELRAMQIDHRGTFNCAGAKNVNAQKVSPPFFRPPLYTKVLTYRIDLGHGKLVLAAKPAVAASYGRPTGKSGVCITTLGPGALNLTTGAACAPLGAMPMIMLTGQKGIVSSRRPSQQRSRLWIRDALNWL